MDDSENGSALSSKCSGPRSGESLETWTGSASDGESGNWGEAERDGDDEDGDDVDREAAGTKEVDRDLGRG